jgi:hypothetical protein
MLGRVKHSVQHPLSPSDAKRAIEAAFGEYSKRFAGFAPQLQWLAPEHAQVGFQALGRKIVAQVRLLDRALEIEMDVPLMARPFQGRATAAIEREVGRWVSVIQGQGSRS